MDVELELKNLDVVHKQRNGRDCASTFFNVLLLSCDSKLNITTIDAATLVGGHYRTHMESLRVRSGSCVDTTAKLESALS